MPTRAGRTFHSRRLTAAEFTAEFRAQELALEVRALSTALVRLRAAARDYLTALPSEKPRTMVRLRHELGHPPAVPDVAA